MFALCSESNLLIEDLQQMCFLNEKEQEACGWYSWMDLYYESTIGDDGYVRGLPVYNFQYK